MLLFLPSLSPQLLTGSAQVLRYTALVTGVGYGFYHQASIAAKTKLAHVNRQNEHQASLIAKAKAEWAKKTMPKEIKEGAGELFSLRDECWLETPSVVRNSWPGRLFPALALVEPTIGYMIPELGLCVRNALARKSGLTMSISQSSLIRPTRNSIWKHI